MTGVELAVAGLLGAIVGSFLNVVAWRLPRGESLVRPGSRCPGCGTPVRPWHNVPILSWALLRGRCASCRAPIAVRYPLVELATAGLYAGAVASAGGDRTAVVGLLLVTALVPIALIDLEHRIIPNVITGPAALAGVAAIAATEPHRLPSHLLAAAIAGGAFLLVALAYPRGMGMGDVKLAGLLGLFLGSAVAPALLVAVAAGSAVGIGIAMRLGVTAARRTAVPFGPFLALGGIVGLFAGAQLVSWYLSTFG